MKGCHISFLIQLFPSILEWMHSSTILWKFSRVNCLLSPCINASLPVPPPLPIAWYWCGTYSCQWLPINTRLQETPVLFTSLTSEENSSNLKWIIVKTNVNHVVIVPLIVWWMHLCHVIAWFWKHQQVYLFFQQSFMMVTVVHSNF